MIYDELEEIFYNPDEEPGSIVGAILSLLLIGLVTAFFFYVWGCDK